MWDHRPLGVWAERLSDGAWHYPWHQQRKLWVKKQTGAHILGGIWWEIFNTCAYKHVSLSVVLCFQVEGSQLHSALRHDSRRGHPVPPGHTETLQDYYEHEWDPGTGESPSVKIILGVNRTKSKEKYVGGQVPEGTGANFSVGTLCSSALKQVMPSSMLPFCTWPLTSDLAFKRRQERTHFYTGIGGISCYLLLVGVTS